MSKAEALFSCFQFEGTPFYAERFGCGHINETYAVYCKFEIKPPVRYILQKINTNVFRDPDGLMQNILGVTEYLREQIIAQGGDPLRETLTVVPTIDGKPYYRDENGDCWRAYVFIENAIDRSDPCMRTIYLPICGCYGYHMLFLITVYHTEL